MGEYADVFVRIDAAKARDAITVGKGNSRYPLCGRQTPDARRKTGNPGTLNRKCASPTRVSELDHRRWRKAGSQGIERARWITLKHIGGKTFRTLIAGPLESAHESVNLKRFRHIDLFSVSHDNALWVETRAVAKAGRTVYTYIISPRLT